MFIKWWKNANNYFPETKMTSSDVFLSDHKSETQRYSVCFSAFTWLMRELQIILLSIDLIS